MNYINFDILTTVATGITIIGVIYGFFRNFKQDINAKIDNLDADIKAQANRMDRHAQRIDQLYQMFVDLLKERKNP